MALNFPSSPTNGQTYTDPTSGNRYTYDGTKKYWRSNSTPILGNSLSTQLLFNDAGLANGSNGITYSSAANTLYVNEIWIKGSNIASAIIASNTWTNTVFGFSNAKFLANGTGSTANNYAYTGNLYITTGNVGIGTATPAYRLEVNGSLAAQTKSFVINHPSKPGMKLQYASLEGPENGVYVRGRTQTNIIELPDYWVDLIDKDSITVNLTPIGKGKSPSILKIENNKVYLNKPKLGKIDCYYIVFAERKDVVKLSVEY